MKPPLLANSDLLKDDEFVVLSARAQHDHFSGGLRLKAQKVFSLADARCLFARYLQIDAKQQLPHVQRILREFPAKVVSDAEGDVVRGLRVRMEVRCQSGEDAALVELDLGEHNRFYPSDAALAAWRAETGSTACQLVWRNS